jgi:hypothetical protein
MRYLCYLSKDRVDSLFETAFESIVDETTSESTRSASGDAEFGVSAILKLIKGGLKLGGKVSSSVETKRRQTAVSRLNAVIEDLKKSRSIMDLAGVIRSGGKFDAEWYEVTTRLRVPLWNPDAAAIDLRGEVESFSLSLACGKDNFSGLYREGDRMIPTSTNRYLFEGKIALPMSGLVKLVGIEPDNRILYGSPLYLVLNPLNEDLGEFNDVEI